MLKELTAFISACNKFHADMLAIQRDPRTPPAEWNEVRRLIDVNKIHLDNYLHILESYLSEVLKPNA